MQNIGYIRPQALTECAIKSAHRWIPGVRYKGCYKKRSYNHFKMRSVKL